MSSCSTPAGVNCGSSVISAIASPSQDPVAKLQLAGGSEYCRIGNRYHVRWTSIRLRIQPTPYRAQDHAGRAGHLPVENLYLDELVKEKIYEFLFVLATPKLKGGTAFPVEPIAIV